MLNFLCCIVLFYCNGNIVKIINVTPFGDFFIILITEKKLKSEGVHFLKIPQRNYEMDFRFFSNNGDTECALGRNEL